MAAGRTTCTKCGHLYPQDFAQRSGQPPCPGCGERGITVELGIAEEVNLACSLSWTLGPYPSNREAARRWREILTDVEQLESRLAEQPGPAAVLETQRRIHTVLVELWSMREVCIKEGISVRDLDDAIDRKPAIALAHDLGNLVKHGTLTRRVRSGQAPSFGDLVAQGDAGGWQVRLDVTHGANKREVLEIVREATDEWMTVLRQWGLLDDPTPGSTASL